MDPDSLAGKRLGHHLILELIGAGGMGIVYKARDVRLSRLVALKVMRRNWTTDAENRRRFTQEAQAASALNHPGIVTIFEIDSVDGFDVIAMEYLDGVTLSELIATGPLPTDRALRLAGLVADALTASHAAGIVHRDLKPSNIMVLPPDRVKVVDFGLAKCLRPFGSPEEAYRMATVTGNIMGTAAYMSPEQASGISVDTRSDLFSLGSILYEMLSGRQPFGGCSVVSTLVAVLRDEPAPLTTVPPEVERLVSRCLRKDVSERFQSAAELKAAIDALRVPGSTGEISGSLTGKPGIAVLPFANMSGEKVDDFLCEGITEEIINALTRIDGLRVIARTSAFAVARMGLDAQEIGTRLGVNTLLEGSVRRCDRRVRVTVRLVRASDGTQLWNERYDRELVDILLLEDEIAITLASRLQVELAPEVNPRRQPMVDVEAYQAYLEGRHHFAKGTPTELAQAKTLFEQAVARAPAFALAYDALAELFWYLGFFGSIPPREAFSMSTWHALRALEIDDGLAETHALLGMLRKELDYNWREVDRELLRAHELSRESPQVRLRHAISGLMPHGRTAEALAELELVTVLDPLSLFVRWWVGVMAYFAGLNERVKEEGCHMIALDPNHFLGHWVLGIGLDAGGACNEAVAALERAHQLSGGIPFTLGFLAYAYGRAGRQDEARGLGTKAEHAAASAYVPPFTVALAHIGLLEWGPAFDWMDRAVEARDPLIMPVKSYPFLQPVRSDPRYRALLEKMNLEP